MTYSLTYYTITYYTITYYNNPYEKEIQQTNGNALELGTKKTTLFLN